MGRKSAGRPKKGAMRIETAFDSRLKWFRLKNYDTLSSLTDLGIYFQILMRQEIFLSLDAIADYKENAEEFRERFDQGQMRKKLDLIMHHPCATLQRLCECGLSLSDFFNLTNFLQAPDAYRFIYPLTLADVLSIEKDVESNADVRKRLFKKIRILEADGDTREANLPRLEVDSTLESIPGHIRHKIPAHDLFDNQDSPIYLVIDPAAPDAALKDAFDSFLAKWRATHQPCPKREFPMLEWNPKAAGVGESPRPKPLTRSQVATYKAIPFVDFALWEASTGYTIAAQAKADLLFANVVSKANRLKKLDTAEKAAWTIMKGFSGSMLEIHDRAREELCFAYRTGDLIRAKGRDFIPKECSLDYWWMMHSEDY